MIKKTDRRRFISQSTLAFCASAVFNPPALPLVESDSSWTAIDGKIYGAKPGVNGPIGGGQGYQRIVRKGDYEVDTLDSLIEALSKATSGQTVFIRGDAEIDLTADIYIDGFFLTIPAGVTLAGSRGYNGSEGPILTSDALKTPLMIKAAGDGVRVTGIRLKGPNPKRYMRHHRRAFGKEQLGRSYYYKFPTSSGIVCDAHHLEVDNCEITAFGHAGISLRSGSGHHIHHNYIHHCQYHGLGYGISHQRASSVIEFNRFDSNRHSIAGTGAADSEYTARHNIELGIASSHCFDMHGGRDRKDGTDIAGRKIIVHNNTFYVPDQRAVVVRGVPVESCEVYQNWFVENHSVREAVRGEDRTNAYDNLFGRENKKVL